MPVLAHCTINPVVRSRGRLARNGLRPLSFAAVASILLGCGSAPSAVDVDTAYNRCADGSGNPHTRIGYCNQAIDSGELTRYDLATAYVMRGVHQQTANRHDDAIRSFDEALYHDPEFSDAYFYRGWSKRELGYDRDALENFETAYRYDPIPKFRQAIVETDRYLEEERSRAEREAARPYSLAYNGLYCP